MGECYNKKIFYTRHKDKNQRFLIKVDCGQCLNCIKNKQLELSLRMRLESYYYDYAINCVLTYDSEHIELINYNKNIDTEKYIVRDFENQKRLLDNKKISKAYFTQYELRYYNILNELATVRERHINNFLDYIKKLNVRKNYKIDFKYVISAEYPTSLKKDGILILRGRPHYHLLVLVNDIDNLKKNYKYDCESLALWKYKLCKR